VAKVTTADTPRTEGQRLLVAVSGSHSEVAAKLGGKTTKQSISEWRLGQKVPGAAARARIQATLGIEPDAWSRQPGGGQQATQAPAALPALGGELEHLEELLRDLRQLRSDRGLTASERARVAGEETKTLRRIAELRDASKLTEARYVHEHPGWQRLKRALLDALKKHPDAYRDVVAALQVLGA
jgi:transcriptional regulator with XRE-family HTH domain